MTSYVAGSTPYIKAFDLNAFQSAINGIINATYSLKSVVIDGTGGSVVAPVPGTARVSSSASGLGPGPTTTVSWGTMYKEAAIFGFANVDAAGAVTSGYNVDSATRVGAGHFQVIFNGAPANPNRCSGAVTGAFNAAARICEINTFGLAGSDLQADVFIYDAAGAAADGAFNIQVWGG